MRRPLLKAVAQPVFLSSFAFVGIALLLEMFQPTPLYEGLKRFGETVLAAMLIASLCADSKALKVALLGVISASLWLSVEVYTASYGTMASAQFGDFKEASRLREQAFEEFGLQANLNRISFLCAQGVVACLALGLKKSALWSRLGLLVGAIFCLLGTFLPQSRSGVVAAVAACLVVLLVYRQSRSRALIVALIVGFGLALVLPKAALSRFQTAGETISGRSDDSRVRVYAAAWEALPNYFWTGVGAGHYHDTWAVEHGLSKLIDEGQSKRVLVIGAHSVFLQILIYWGIAGLAMYLFMLWRAYRCLPRHCEADHLALALLGLTVAMGMRLLFTQNFYVKDFALVLGLLAAARMNIWPRGRILPRDRGVNQMRAEGAR
jgi:O-antigen ligase